MSDPEPRAGTTASGAPSEDPDRDGRARLIAALRRPGSRGQLAAGVLLAVLGFAAVVQVQSNSRDATYVGARQDELIALINGLSLASQRAENEMTRLAQTRNSLLTDTEARRTALERARQLADERGILAGTLAAVGPGVRVSIEDESGAVGAGNVINGIQELRDAGAEAIEINDMVRVVAQTSVRDLEEGGVVIDRTRLTAPYVIEAIGSSPTLSGGLQIARGFAYEIQRVGGTVDIKELETVEIDSVREPASTEYAEPVPTE
ncbi:MAG: DUF881 domain-containing protein [Nocardioides sp.]